MQEVREEHAGTEAASAPVHVTLIRPPMMQSPDALVGSQASPAMALALLGSVCLEQGYEVTALDATGMRFHRYVAVEGSPYVIHGLTADEIVAEIPRHTRVIGISCMFSNEWFYHRRVVDAIAKAFPDVPIIMGGEHATAAGDYVLRCCPGVTACALGEGEETFLDFVDAVVTGRDLDTVPGLLLRGDQPDAPKTTAPRKRMRALDDLPWPAWDITPIRRYLDEGASHGVVKRRAMPMLASRGCPYRCTFCSNPQMWGKLWNTRDPREVVAEMKHYKDKYNADTFTFYDLTAIVKKSWILEFCKLLEAEALDVQWLLPSGTRSEALDEEVLAAMRRAGCYHVVLAPESGSEETLRLIKKQVNLEKMVRTIRGSIREGIYTRATIVLGFPGETPRNMFRSLGFMLKMTWYGIHDIGVFPFAPYPGSELHKMLAAKGAFPPDGDAYDRFLAATINNDYRNVRSWNEYLSDRQLQLMVVGAEVMFYCAQYALRPWRLAAMVVRLVTNNPVTNVERVLYNHADRFRRFSAASSEGQ